MRSVHTISKSVAVGRFWIDRYAGTNGDFTAFVVAP